MAERYFNAEQEAHMRYLGSVPRSERCGSGWHVKAHESCECIDQHECVCRHVKAIHTDDGCRGRWKLLDRSDRGGHCPCSDWSDRWAAQEGRDVSE